MTHSRNDLRFTLFFPLADFGIDLVPELRFDLTRISGEESQEPLCPAVDHVDFM